MLESGKPDDMVELDLRQLIRALWAGKWVIIAMTTVAAVISVLVALMLPDVYRSQALLAPNNQHDTGGMAGLNMMEKYSPPSSEIQVRDRRPRPFVCCWAMTTVKSGQPLRARSLAVSMVEGISGKK